MALDAWASWRRSMGNGPVDVKELERASQRLLPLLERNLKRLGVQDESLASLHGVARQTWCENQMILARGAGLVGGLEKQGIATLLFKGCALTLCYYNSYALRPMNDFDVLVPTAQAKQAFDWVLANGWTFDTQGDPALLSDVYLENLHGHGFRNQQGHSVDVHRHLLHQCSGPDADTDFWEASVPLQISGVSTHTLCAADHLLVALMHGIHWDSTSPLRWVADAMTILKVESPAMDWERLFEQTRKRQLVLPVLAGLRYLKNTFQAPVPDSMLRDLERIPVNFWQKMEFNGWTTSHETHSPLMRFYLRYLWFRKWEISRGWRGKVFGLPLYLQHAWKLRSPWQIPRYALVRAGQQVRARFTKKGC